MKKLLTLISAVGMGATGLASASNVVSCSKKDDKNSNNADPVLISIDDKNMPGNGDSIVTVTVSGDTATKLGDYDGTKPEKNKFSADITVEKEKDNDKLNADDKSTKLADILKDVKIESGTKLSAAKATILTAIKAVITDASDADINVTLKKINIKTIDIPAGQYGIEKTQPWILKDDKSNQADYDRYTGYVLNNLNATLGLDNSSKQLKAKDVTIDFSIDLNPKTQAPQKATVTVNSTDESILKILNDDKKVDVVFIFNQNIEADAFVIGDAHDGDAKKFVGFGELICDKEQNTLTLNVVKGKALSLNSTNLANAGITEWKNGNDYKDDFWQKDGKGDNTSGITVGDATASGIAISASKAKNTTAEDASVVNHITFKVEGFKEFKMTINVVAEVK